ncbi:MAG: DUF6152 family protein [Gammaproteobacteria bacterium]|nr:DUF6152 family protein [Gammaproteobacteria bacterium]
MKLIIATSMLVLMPTVVQTHHSTRAFYDRAASAQIEGVITSLFWRNPHVGLTLLVRNEQGEQEEWDLEGGTINTLRRRGFSEDSFAVGDRVRVAGAPSIRGLNALFVTNMLLPSGQEVVFTDQPRPPLWTMPPGAPATASPSGPDTRVLGERAAPDLFRVWSLGRIYRLEAPLALTDAATAARSAWDPIRDDPSLRCEPPGMPNAILNPYPIEFIDEGDRIRLKIEEWDAVRTIYMTDTASPQDTSSSRLGYSRGIWDGDTLIVRTSHIEAPFLDDSGTPMSEAAQMIERFSLRSDEGRLDYEVTVTDPAYLVEPAVWNAAWIWRPGLTIQTFDCALN